VFLGFRIVEDIISCEVDGKRDGGETQAWKEAADGGCFGKDAVLSPIVQAGPGIVCWLWWGLHLDWKKGI
jgi:hypothetical protein